ncbi:MAG: hypothetical protein IJU48_11080 [Synergistaceae bacterium]|nr:hypothetical protein [Synergistaceae bacterium]
MRKFWGLFLVMSLCVFMFSGCGGNVYDEGTSETPSTDETPNNYPDSYDTASVLNGTWIMIEGADSITLDYDENSIELQQISGTTIFSNTQLKEDTGVSFVTSHTSWHAFLDGDTRSYMGILPIDIDDKVVSMTHIGSNKWRGEIYDTYRTVMEIEILSDKTMTIQQKGVVFIDDTHGVDYDITFTFRKQ